MEKPSVTEIARRLRGNNKYGYVTVEALSERNHLIYSVKTLDGQAYALRMINPESYRKDEWITMAEEYEILGELESTGLGPKVYALDNQFSPPFIIQEFIEGQCFNDLKPLSEEHLVAAAQAIAKLNSQRISRVKFSFMEKYVKESFQKTGRVWFYRLVDSVRRSRQKDVLHWALRIAPVAMRARFVLGRYKPLFSAEPWTFHFDGAHCGNTFWYQGRVVFLDWQKVSWRRDPSFTLVRFATSTGEKGEVTDSVMSTLIRAYLEVRDIPDFRTMVNVRLLERQVSDLVWVLWDSTRRRDRRPVEEATSVVPRYAEVKRLLYKY